MNKDNVLALADAIEKRSVPNLGFDMNVLRAPVENSCGTVACIAGWTCLVFETPLGFAPAREVLGLDQTAGTSLFYPSTNSDDPGWDATPSQAVSVLRHLAETGEVDWPRALAEPATP